MTLLPPLTLHLSSSLLLRLSILWHFCRCQLHCLSSFCIGSSGALIPWALSLPLGTQFLSVYPPASSYRGMEWQQSQSLWPLSLARQISFLCGGGSCGGIGTAVNYSVCMKVTIPSFMSLLKSFYVSFSQTWLWGVYTFDFPAFVAFLLLSGLLSSVYTPQTIYVCFSMS